MSHDSSPSISNALRLYKLILSSGITIPFSYIAAIPAVLITALEVKQAGEEALEERHNFQEVFCALRTTTTVDDSIPDPPSDSYLTIRRSLIDQCYSRLEADMQKQPETKLASLAKSASIDQALISLAFRIMYLHYSVLITSTLETQEYFDEISTCIQRLACKAKDPLSPHFMFSELTHLSTGASMEVIAHRYDPKHYAKDQAKDMIVRWKGRRRIARIYDSVNGAKNLLKDLALYSRLKHPYISDLFGISSHNGRPALLFHDDFCNVSCLEQDATMGQCERVLFFYNLHLDYLSAHKYLAKQLELKRCVAFIYEKLEPEIFDNGCTCSRTHPFQYKTMVNESARRATITLAPYNDGPTYAKTMIRINPGDVSKSAVGFLDRLINTDSLSELASLSPREKAACLRSFHSMVLSLNYRSIGFRSRLEVPLFDLCESCNKHDGATQGHPMLYGDPSMTRVGFLTFEPDLPDSNKWRSREWELDYGRNVKLDRINGRTRVTLTPTHDLFYENLYTSCNLENADLLYHAWISQFGYIVDSVSSNLDVPSSQPILTTHVECQVHFLDSIPENSNLHEVYLFIDDFTPGNDGVLRRPKAFWSSDPTGAYPMSEETLRKYDLRAPVITMRSHGITWSVDSFHAVFIFQRACGLDPRTHDAAKLLGLPLAKLNNPIPRLRRRYSDPPRVETREVMSYENDSYDEWYNHSFSPKSNLPFKRLRRRSISGGEEDLQTAYELLHYESY